METIRWSKITSTRLNAVVSWVTDALAVRGLKNHPTHWSFTEDSGVAILFGEEGRHLHALVVINWDGSLRTFKIVYGDLEKLTVLPYRLPT